MQHPALDDYMAVVTAFIYWALVLSWSAIAIFYGRQYLRLRRSHPVLTILLIVLFIDAARTLIENVYFGVRYSAQIGWFPAVIYYVLQQPYYVAIPKALNLIAALVIILVIVRRWFSSLEREERQRRAAEQLRSELIALASHELRAPLTSIGGYAQTLVREFGHLAPETQREFLEGIASEAERLEHLISDLLDMSQIDEGQLRIERRRVAPGQLCEEAVRTASHPNLRHVLQVDIAPGTPDVLADPGRIHQVLSNLLSNAVKFSPEGSTVTVRARRADGQVEFSVTDRGVGIPREEQAMVFSRFHRAANAHTPDTPGAGLGLYISKAIVEAHGGRMWLHSELGHGATFFFSLPVAEAQCQEEGAASQPQPDRAVG